MFYSYMCTIFVLEGAMVVENELPTQLNIAASTSARGGGGERKMSFYTFNEPLFASVPSPCLSYFDVVQ